WFTVQFYPGENRDDRGALMTPTPAPLAITGSTGALGGRVARLLADAGIAHRLLVRDPSRAPDLPATTIHPATYQDTPETRAALDGVHTLFMVSGAEHPDRRA